MIVAKLHSAVGLFQVRSEDEGWLVFFFYFEKEPPIDFLPVLYELIL
jgi:hypothetical protein